MSTTKYLFDSKTKMGMISPAIPIFFSILAAVAMSTPGIEDAVISTLTCVGAEQKSYECLLDYDVEDNSPKSIKSISNEIEELKSLARQQNETIEELKASVKQQNETISNLNASINVFTTMFESHEIKRNVSIGFYADSPPNLMMTSGVVVFPNVVLNEGGRYNSVTGIFTADRPGLYHFTVDMAINPKNTVLHIRNNSVAACTTFGRAHDTIAAVHTGCSTVLELSTEDNVDVFISSTELPDPIDENLPMSSFKGFLIHSY